MKAKLLISMVQNHNAFDEFIDGDYLELTLVLSERKHVNIMSLKISGDKEEFLGKLEECLNEATQYINALQGIKFVVGESVYEFIEDDDDEQVRKLINHLLVEI